MYRYVEAACHDLDFCCGTHNMAAGVCALTLVLTALQVSAEVYRLPHSIQPTHYRIDIQPHFQDENFTLYGQVWIDIRVLNKTQDIILHSSKELHIFEDSITLGILQNDTLESIPFPAKPLNKYDETINNGIQDTFRQAFNITENLDASDTHTTPSNITISNLKSVPGPLNLTSLGFTTTSSPILNSTLNASEVVDIQNTTLNSSRSVEVKVAPHRTARQVSVLEHYNISFSRFNTNLIHIRTELPLKAGQRYRLHIRYKGYLSNTLTGFYRSSYYIHKNSKQTRWLASTTFEPNEARRAFPCFDEPGFKARFQVNLASRLEDVALSNMPANSTQNMTGQSGWKWTRFQQTPLMPTYLIAFFVGKLESRETQTSSGTPIRVWARPAVVSQTKYALDIAPRILEYFNKLIGVQEPLPKHDILALPRFVADALENWGLISFGETYLLYEPGISSASTRQQVATTISHELAHSWFGNMVTLRWWSDIWLNEGFASYFAMLGADHIQPNWDAVSVATVRAFLHVFSVDSLYSSHPLTFPLDNENDLRQIFDSITYFKGFYILRMLNHTLGESTFLAGCRRYVMRNRFRSVDQQDLWDALTEQAHLDGTLLPDQHLGHLMDTWSTQPGFPVITVERNYTANSATITQARFKRPKADVETRRRPASWWIPLTYTTEDNPDFNSTKPKKWLNPGSSETHINGLPDNQSWVIFNIQAAGLYRVNYDLHNWDLISKFLTENYTEISVLNRALLMDDALDLARVGLLSYPVALNVTSYLHQEENYLPWKAVLSNLGYISRMLRSTEALTSYKGFIRHLVEPQFRKMGFDPPSNASHLKIMHHKEIVQWACISGLPACVSKSVKLMEAWSDKKINSIPKSLRSVVYCAAVEHGSSFQWYFLWEHYKNSTVASERRITLMALGCSQDEDTLRGYIRWSIQKNSGVKAGDSATVFKAVASTDAGYSIAKEFLFNNVDIIEKTVGPFFLTEILEQIASRMNQPKQLEELQEFQKKNAHRLQQFTRSVNQVNERVKYNIEWIENNYQNISKWLQDAQRKWR